MDRFRSLADRGDAYSLFMMGQFYGNGYGVKKNPAKAHAFWLKSARLREANALVRIADALTTGDDFVPQDLRKAALLYSMAAEQGHPEAAPRLREIYKKNRKGSPGRG